MPSWDSEKVKVNRTKGYTREEEDLEHQAACGPVLPAMGNEGSREGEAPLCVTLKKALGLSCPWVLE